MNLCEEASASWERKKKKKKEVPTSTVPTSQSSELRSLVGME